MNIVIGLFVIISALVLRHFYKVNGKRSKMIFRMCMAIGVFMLFSVQTFDSALLAVMTAAEILLCTLLLVIYRTQLVREAAALRRRKAVRRHKMAVQASAPVVRTKRVIPNAA